MANGTTPYRQIHYHLDAFISRQILIQLLASCYSAPGDEIAMDRYAYLYFGTAARIAGATPVRADGDDVAPNVARLLGSVTERTRLVFLDNPNNPSGGYLDCRQLAELRRGLRDDVLLVIDAAYAEFVTASGYEPGIDLVEAGGNCVMLRTFSKIYGLAGARLGWAYGSAEVAAILNRVRLPVNASIPAQAAGLAALAEQERVGEIRAETARVRGKFADGVAGLGLLAHPSQGNFVLVRFADAATAKATYEALQSEGIMSRPMAAYGLTDHLRFTVGTETEMDEALRAIAKRTV